MMHEHSIRATYIGMLHGLLCRCLSAWMCRCQRESCLALLRFEDGLKGILGALRLTDKMIKTRHGRTSWNSRRRWGGMDRGVYDWQPYKDDLNDEGLRRALRLSHEGFAALGGFDFARCFT